MILKHISALARTLCDTLKMILMHLISNFGWQSLSHARGLSFTVTVIQAN